MWNSNNYADYIGLLDDLLQNSKNQITKKFKNEKV